MLPPSEVRCENNPGQVAALRIRSIAFPAIRRGTFRYPVDQATDIAISTIASGLAAAPLDQVIVTILNPDVAEIYQSARQKVRVRP